MIIGFTGSRAGLTDAQIEVLTEMLMTYDATVVHHGACVGADTLLHGISVALGCRVEIWPAFGVDEKWKAKNLKAAVVHVPQPPLERNKDIVAAAGIVIAAPKEFDEQMRSGTWATIRHARIERKPIFIIFPDGTVKKENWQ